MAVARAPASAALSLAAAAGGQPLLFRQLFDAGTGTFTYLLADVSSRQGLLIDSVFEQHDRDLSLIRELGIELLACLDTHAHADHVTGSWLMHAATGSAIGLAASVGAEHVSLPLQHGDRVAFGERALEVRATPGHTNGCLSFVLDDHSLAFCGDALLVRGCGRCDFQQGDAHTLLPLDHRATPLVAGVLPAFIQATTTPAEASPRWLRRRPSTPASVARPTNAISSSTWRR